MKIALLIPCLLLSSCVELSQRLSWWGSPPSLKNSEDTSAIPAALPQNDSYAWKLQIDSSTGAAVLHAENSNICSSPHKTVWNLSGSYGEQRLALSVYSSTGSNNSRPALSVGGKRYTLASAPADLSPLQKKFCAQAKPHDLELSPQELAQLVQPWLTAASPECRWQWQAGQGFVCTLAEAPTQHTEHDLAVLKKTLLAQWLRPPYLMLRRLSILEQLSELNQADAHKQANLTQQFCQGLAHALSDEKPLVMNSPVWHREFCEARTPEQRQHAYRLGSSYGLRELHFFQKLAALSTHKGHLHIKLPEDNLVSKELWIKLEAHDDVVKSVWNKARELAGHGHNSPTGEANAALPFPAWHPLFSYSPEATALASLFSEVTTTAGSSSEELDDSIRVAMSRYLSSSLQGETTFSLHNGQSKVLQLPLGHYHYTLYDLPTDDANWVPQQSHKTSKGTISWLEQAPKPTIAEWNSPAASEADLVGATR